MNAMSTVKYITWKQPRGTTEPLTFVEAMAIKNKHLDAATAKPEIKDFNGPGDDLWSDAQGNLQLKTNSENKPDGVASTFQIEAILSFQTMPSSGSKSILMCGRLNNQELLIPLHTLETDGWSEGVMGPSCKDFEISTANMLIGNFEGRGHDIWIDARGNMQLQCRALTKAPDVLVAEKGEECEVKFAYDLLSPFKALSCMGKKSVLVLGASNGADFLLPLDGLEQNVAGDIVMHQGGYFYYVPPRLHE